MKPFDILESEISTEDPIPIDLEGKTLYLKGRIDRIDLTKDGKRARVIDYKTGKVSAKENDFQGGRTLQLPLYLYVASKLLGRLHPGIEVQTAEYYFIKYQKRVPFKASELMAKREELQSILKIISQGIEEGVFMAVPGNLCQLCDFKIICGTWTETLFERKAKDPRVKRYLEMVGIMVQEAKE